MIKLEFEQKKKKKMIKLELRSHKQNSIFANTTLQTQSEKISK